MQARLDIPDLNLDLPTESCSAQKTRCKFHRSKVEVVEPFVSRDLGHHATDALLPWGRIASQVCSRSQAVALENWWNLRVRGTYDGASADTCPACGAFVCAGASHFATTCAAAASHLRGACLRQSDLFVEPLSAHVFRTQLCRVSFLTAP